MPRVRFTATADLPTWTHRKGRAVESTYAGEATVKVVPPIILRSGDIVEMDDFDAQWCIVNLPSNMSLVEPKAKETKRRRTSPADESAPDDS